MRTDRALKKTTSILLVATLVLGISLLANNRMPQASALQAKPIKISRVISVSNYGLTFITDQITLQEGNSVSIGMPIQYSNNILEYYSSDREVAVTRFSNPQYPNLTFINITSPSPRERIDLVTVLRGVISQDASAVFNLTVPKAPVLLEEVQTFDVSILLPKDVDITPPAEFNVTSTNQTVMLYTNTTTLKPLSTKDLSISFKSETIHLLSVNSDEVTLTFDGKLDVQEKLSLRFEGTGEIDTVHLRIPNQSKEVLVKGIVAELDRTVGNESQGLLTVAVKLRQPIANKENVSFTIRYKVPADIFVTTSNDKHTVSFPQSLNTTYDDYTIWMVFPSTHTIKAFEPVPQGFVREDPYRTKLMYRRSNTALRTNNTVQLDYQTALNISEYYSWIWGAAILLGAVGLAARLTPLTGPKPLAITPESKNLIEETLEGYGRLKKLRQQVLTRPAVEAMGKGGAPLLRETLRTIQRESERIRDATRKLRKAQPTQASTLTELEKVEVEIQQLLSAYDRVNDDLRRGRISKKVAQNIQKEYTKQIHAHITTEDEMIEEIKRTTE